MRGIILIGDEHLTINNIAKISFGDCEKYFMDDICRISLSYPDGRLYFDDYEGLTSYEDSEIDQLRKFYNEVDKLNFIALAYTSKKILYVGMLCLKDVCLLVEDDYGNIMKYDDYLKVLYLETLSHPND